MIIDYLKKLRHVRKYNNKSKLDDNLVNELLYLTWQVTPSKNNFMPYNVHVIGPKDDNLKNIIYNNCVSNENKVNSLNKIKDANQLNANYMNILNCSHLLIFTSRLEDKLNPVQENLIKRGIYLE